MGRAARRSGLQDRAAAPDLHGPGADSLRPAGRSLSPALQGPPHHYWLNDAVVDAGADDRAQDLLARPGWYTTARVQDGVARFGERHARRLLRDARALGLSAPDEDSVQTAFEALARAEFGTGEGVVRLACCQDGSGATHLVGVPRPVGAEPATWRALTAPFPHPGPIAPLGVKRAHQPTFERARTLCSRAGVDECLLFDSAGRLVEGGRTNILVVDEGGRLLFPAPALGAVAGVALEILRESLDALEPAELDARTIRRARELVAVNAVRGACPLVELDHRSVGDGRMGPWSRELRAMLA